MSLSDLAAAPQPSRAKRGEGDRTREAILRAAEDLLTESGSESAVNIRAVAERVGLTPPAIYRYFADKDHLMFEVCGVHFDALEDLVISPVLASTDDPVEALRRIGEGYVRFGMENPEHYRIMFMRHHDHTPEQYADDRVLERGSFASMISLIGRGIESGALRQDIDPACVTWALWSALHGLVALLVSKPNMPGPPVQDRIDALLEIVMTGALPR